MKGLTLAAVIAGHQWAEVGECDSSRLHYTSLQSTNSKGWNYLYMSEKDFFGNWTVEKSHGQYVWKLNDNVIEVGISESYILEPTYVCSYSETLMELSETKNCFRTTVWERCGGGA